MAKSKLASKVWGLFCSYISSLILLEIIWFFKLVIYCNTKPKRRYTEVTYFITTYFSGGTFQVASKIWPLQWYEWKCNPNSSITYQGKKIRQFSLLFVFIFFILIFWCVCVGGRVMQTLPGAYLLNVKGILEMSLKFSHSLHYCCIFSQTFL